MSASSNAPDSSPRGEETEWIPDQFSNYATANRSRIERALSEYLPVSNAPGTERFNQAVQSAVFPGGKRLRPLLSLIASDVGSASEVQALQISCAVEFIHTSSLIMDDLPSMDDAELRRNQPALHNVFGEGIAVLTSVALLNQAYLLFAESPENDVQTEKLPHLFREVAGCVGHSGMIAGQAVELALSGAVPDDAVLSTRALKTTSLMRLGLTAGGIISGAPDEDIAALATYGEYLGSAYQIFDDLADRSSDHQTTGKSAGQDLRHLRPTMIRGLTPTEVRKLGAEAVESGKHSLARFGDHPGAKLLKSAADHIVGGFSVSTS